MDDKLNVQPIEGQQDEVRTVPGQPTEEQVNAWKHQYGQKGVFRLEGQADAEDDDSEPVNMVIYCRRPNPQHMNRFSATAQKDPYKALRDLVFDTRLWPDAELVKAAFDERPGLAIALGGKLQQIAGTNADFRVKRF